MSDINKDFRFLIVYFKELMQYFNHPQSVNAARCLKHIVSLNYGLISKHYNNSIGYSRCCALWNKATGTLNETVSHYGNYLSAIRTDMCNS